MASTQTKVKHSLEPTFCGKGRNGIAYARQDDALASSHCRSSMRGGAVDGGTKIDRDS